MRQFWSQIYVFLFLPKTGQLDKFEGADLKYENSFFLILAQKYLTKAFLVPNLDVFFIS